MGIWPRVEGDPGVSARRAIELALLGEPERCDSARKDDEGIGRALGDVEGLPSFCVKRPAIVACRARPFASAVGQSVRSLLCFQSERLAGRLDFVSAKRNNDEGQVHAPLSVLCCHRTGVSHCCGHSDYGHVSSAETPD